MNVGELRKLELRKLTWNVFWGGFLPVLAALLWVCPAGVLVDL